MANVNTNILFIDVDYIRNNSQFPIPEVVDNSYLQNSIIQSQVEDIQKVTGSPLFNSLYNYEYLYLTTGQTIPTDYDNLITQYIKPLLMYFSLYRALRNLEYKIMNTSIVIKKDANNSNQITDSNFNDFKREIMKNIEFWLDMTIRFIQTQNSKYDKFPEYTNFSADIDTIMPMRGRGYGKQGLYFGKKKNGWYYGPNNSYDMGTTGMGWNSEKGSAREDICC